MLLTIVSFIIVLGILIFIHEFGHYISAKLAGIRVEEFALGFGPKIISHKQGETVYSIRGIPLGGFCKMTGEFPPDEEMSAEDKEIYEEARKKGQCFDQKAAWKRFAVVFNGPFMNFLLAAIIYILIFGLYGLPVDSTNSNIIGEVFPGQPAAEAGLRSGDEIIAINGQEIDNWQELADLIHKSNDKKMLLKLKHNGETREVEVTPRYDERIDGGVIGIAPELIRKKVGFTKTIKLGFLQAWYVFKMTLVGFYQMITGNVPADIAGPVMIASMIGQAAEIGLNSLLNLMAIISINLGIINLLPFPALDGGRIVFIIVEVFRGKPVDPEKEGFVHIIGFVILMVLMVFIVFKDLRRALF